MNTLLHIITTAASYNNFGEAGWRWSYNNTIHSPATVAWSAAGDSGAEIGRATPLYGDRRLQ